MATPIDDGTSETCVSCRGLFRSQNTVTKLKSNDGLVYRRSLLSMETSARDGCVLCQELLNMDLSSELDVDLYNAERKLTALSPREAEKRRQVPEKHHLKTGPGYISVSRGLGV
jgi:hypothetical protein